MVLGAVGLPGVGIWLGISKGGAVWWWMLVLVPAAILLVLLGAGLRSSATTDAAETARLLRDGTRLIAFVVDFTELPGEVIEYDLRLEFEHPTHGPTVVNHRCGKWEPPVGGRRPTLSIIVTDDTWAAPHRPTK